MADRALLVTCGFVRYVGLMTLSALRGAPSVAALLLLVEVSPLVVVSLVVGLLVGGPRGLGGGGAREARRGVGQQGLRAALGGGLGRGHLAGAGSGVGGHLPSRRLLGLGVLGATVLYGDVEDFVGAVFVQALAVVSPDRIFLFCAL